jgi:hypothetical protein
MRYNANNSLDCHDAEGAIGAAIGGSSLFCAIMKTIRATFSVAMTTRIAARTETRSVRRCTTRRDNIKYGFDHKAVQFRSMPCESIKEKEYIMKKFYESKTFWFNVLAGLVAVAGVFGYASFEPSQNTVEIIGVIVAAVNIVLRFVTKEGIDL